MFLARGSTWGYAHYVVVFLLNWLKNVWQIDIDVREFIVLSPTDLIKVNYHGEFF